MKKVITIAVLAIGMIGLSQQVNAQTTGDAAYVTENGSRYLPAREIPVPALASEELQNYIANTPFNEPLAIPQSQEEWLDLIESRNAIAGQNAMAVAQALQVTVEEGTINGATVRYVTPPVIAQKYQNSIFVHTHGGAYVFNGGDASVLEAAIVASQLQIPVISIDYRKPPLHPFPAGLNDAVAGFKGIKEMYPNHTLYMGGTSAGGNITMATTLKLKDEGHALPDALFLGTPGVGFDKVGDSFFINEGLDKSLYTWDGFITACLELYANGEDFNHPYIAPMHGQLEGFPPTFLVSGTRDLLLSATVVSHRNLRDAGVTADLVVIEGHSHGEYLMPSPEADAVYKDLDNFFTQYIKEAKNVQ